MKTKEFEWQEKKYIVRTPTVRQNQDARRVYIKAWNEAKKESVLRPNLTKFLIENGIWTPEDDAKLSTLENTIESLEDFLEEGECSEEEGIQKATDCHIARIERLALLSKKTAYDSITAEAQAENAQFDYLLSVCLVYDNGEKVFKSFDEFLDCQDTELIETASSYLSSLVHGVSWETLLNDTPEMRFINEHAATKTNEADAVAADQEQPKKRRGRRPKSVSN